MTPFYLAAYDTESVRCIKGVRAIVRQHLKYQVPATFFVVGELLEDEDWAAEAKELLSDPSFDVQSHTYTHRAVFPSPYEREPDAGYKEAVVDEIKKANTIIEKVFGKKPIGYRPPGGYEDGLGRAGWLLNALWREGIRFISSQLAGPGHTYPTPLCNPYWNETDVLRPLLELPAYGWHDNALKGYQRFGASWPPVLPWGYPTHAVTTPEEEFDVHKKGIDYILEDGGYLYYSPVMHPWSTYRFNKDAETLGLLLAYVREMDMPCKLYADVYREIESGGITI